MRADVTGESRTLSPRKWFPLRHLFVRRVANVHASEGGAAAAADAAVSTPVGALMAGHVLRDGELVLLILRPSRWFILLSSLKFMAIVTIFTIFGVLFEDALHIPRRRAVEAGVWLGIGRVMWAVLQWMGRLYVLTDLRVVRLSGVFNVDIIDCPLRKVAQARLVPSFRERLVRLGSIEVIPRDDTCPAADWRTIANANSSISDPLRLAPGTTLIIPPV